MEAINRSPGAVQTLWQELLRGALKIEGTPLGTGYDLLLAPSEPARSTAKEARRLASVDAVLRGRSQKAAAVDFGVSPATIAAALKEMANGAGLNGRFSRIPTALPLLAHAANGPYVVSLTEVGDRQAAGRHWLVSLSRPDKALADVLSRAQREVVHCYIAGKSHAEIAAERRTSCRTIANQLAEAFKRLGARGRFSLIAALVERSAALSAPITLSLRAVATHHARIDSDFRELRPEPHVRRLAANAL